MQIFNVDVEPIVNEKYCACCKHELDTKTLIYYGHSNYKPLNGDCCSYICEHCAKFAKGYISLCECVDYF